MIISIIIHLFWIKLHIKTLYVLLSKRCDDSFLVLMTSIFYFIHHLSNFLYSLLMNLSGTKVVCHYSWHGEQAEVLSTDAGEQCSQKTPAP